MVSNEQAGAERVGLAYDREQMYVARRLTFDAIDEIARQIRPGMREEEGVAAAKATLKQRGLLRGWHAVHVRFGRNTLLDYYDASEPGVVLAQNDIFYLDIGPVWEKWEGDGGDTFVVGNDAEMHRARRDVHLLFDRVQAQWRTESSSGAALYEFAAAQARELGWLLNLKVAGHRIGDFPHKAHHSGSLAATGFTPTSDLWVLEMQIRHPERPFGAFYEDLLLETVPLTPSTG
ncbi:MAG: M24 family metallopeptidase [Pseudomonadota bacterium]